MGEFALGQPVSRFEDPPAAAAFGQVRLALDISQVSLFDPATEQRL